MRASILAFVLVACGSPQPGVQRTQRERPTQTTATDLRALGADATFGDLLRAARTLDDRRDQESSAGCLVRRSGNRWRLEADLAVAVRPLPPAPDDLDARMSADPGPVNVLSRWGAYGTGETAHASFTAVTTTLPPRREPAVVWVLTDRGVYVRSSREASTERGALTPQAALAMLPSDVGALFLTGEARLPLSRIASVFALVPSSTNFGLAAVLAPDTRLPAPPNDRAADAGSLCPNGLSELRDDVPVGELRAPAVVQSLAPLRQGAEICVGTASGPGAAGGRVVLALRIGAEGRVTEACIVTDATNDPTLRECLLRAARATAFPTPDPPGAVDVQLPLALAPLASNGQRPLCVVTD